MFVVAGDWAFVAAGGSASAVEGRERVPVAGDGMKLGPVANFVVGLEMAVAATWGATPEAGRCRVLVDHSGMDAGFVAVEGGLGALDGATRRKSRKSSGGGGGRVCGVSFGACRLRYLYSSFRPSCCLC